MANLEEGSIVWARRTLKDKWWPSIVFTSWEAAKDAGFVPDGIAWLIECGRKVDVTDEEAQPAAGEMLNLYLGETPEWELIPQGDDHLLPFTKHRGNLSKQRLGAQLKHQFAPALAAADAMVRQQQQQQQSLSRSGTSPIGKANMAHMNPKRTGVLLDFGTGTSFASFAELWNYLRHNGWATVPGKGLASWHYFPPGSDPKMPHPMLRRDFFDSEDAVIDHVRRTGLERPAPVATVIPRTSPASSKKRSSITRDVPSPTPPPSAERGSSTVASNGEPAAAGTAAAAAAAAPNAAAAAAASSPSAAVLATPSEVVAAEGRDIINGHASSNGAAPAATAAVAAVAAVVGSGRAVEGNGAADASAGAYLAAEGNNSDGAAGPEEFGGGGIEAFREWGGGDDVSSDEGSLVVEGLDAEATEGEEKKKGPARRMAVEGREERRDAGHMDPPLTGGKRSHGRSMQVEAAQVSIMRGAPNLRRQAMRQAVTARRLANSPPAPSPSKKPKRAGPQLAPKELARLTKRQLKTIRGLLEGVVRPFPMPCGVQKEVDEVTRFMTRAHGAWMLSRQAISPAQAAKPAGGAMIIAGPPGSGKSTVVKTAMKVSMMGLSKAKTLRLTTIKSDTLSADDPHDIFSRMLQAVTASAASMGGSKALETLGRLEPSRVFTVFLIEDVDAKPLDLGALELVLELSYRSESSFAVILAISSIDRAIAMKFDPALERRDCRVIPMLPCEEDRLRAILGQTLGASGAEDIDGEVVASLVNKAALDTIASTVARMCGNIRVALTVCEVALARRLRDLEEYCAATASAGPKASSSAAAAAAAAAAAGQGSAASPSAGGGGSSSAGTRGRGLGGCPPSSSPPTGSAMAAVTACTLLTVAGAKAAINAVMLRGLGELGGPGMAEAAVERVEDTC